MTTFQIGLIITSCVIAIIFHWISWITACDTFDSVCSDFEIKKEKLRKMHKVCLFIPFGYLFLLLSLVFLFGCNKTMEILRK